MILDSCLAACKKIQNYQEETSGVFDKFKDMAELDENFFMKITGWTKSEFITFSKYIARVRDTGGRTKDQLPAIYRYWFRDV